ncbi:MAG TPA: CBS domain-containing protein [Methanoregulaceae archaeon]|nr:CBS domain-containing protein [Methanoregulaceae archaeon]
MHIPTPEELKARREFLGIKQTELAQKAGISQSMVARIEGGNVDPRVGTLNKMVQVLNATVRPKVTAAHVMNTPVLSLHPSDSITSAVEIMDKDNISQIPVIEDGVPVGCISETAIVNAIEQQGQPRTHSLVRHYMESSFPTVSPDTDIETVVRILQNHHAVLVIESGKVKGVITKHDLISLIVNH